MAIAQCKENSLKYENVLSSRDYLNNDKSRISVKSHIPSTGDGNSRDLNIGTFTDITDVESAYEGSFCSDITEESELTNISHHSSLYELPTCKCDKSYMNMNKKFSIPNSSFTLEDRIKCLNFDEVQPCTRLQSRSIRKNMSFTNEEIMRIEQDNEALLRRIMTHQKPQKKKIQPIQTRLTSSAVNRKRLHRRIEQDNMILLQRLQQAKSCVLTANNKTPQYRETRL